MGGRNLICPMTEEACDNGACRRGVCVAEHEESTRRRAEAYEREQRKLLAEALREMMEPRK